MPTDQAAFAAAKPIYETMPGWSEDISQVPRFDDLPATCQDYVKRLEELSGCRISAIGTGPQRDHIIRSIRFSTDFRLHCFRALRGHAGPRASQ
jgi:adenylosuccinate synthase